MENEKCYLLTGKLESEADAAVFTAAKKIITEKNIKTVSPESITSEMTDFWKRQNAGETDLDWETYIVGLVANLMYLCDGIILLPGWEESKEANALKTLCEIYSREILYFNSLMNSNI